MDNFHIYNSRAKTGARFLLEVEAAADPASMDGPVYRLGTTLLLERWIELPQLGVRARIFAGGNQYVEASAVKAALLEHFERISWVAKLREIELRRPEEVEELKAKWLRDPCWDIEDTDGFGAHSEELLAYRLECEAEKSESREAAQVKIDRARSRHRSAWLAALTGAISTRSSRDAMVMADEVVLELAERLQILG